MINGARKYIHFMEGFVNSTCLFINEFQKFILLFSMKPIFIFIGKFSTLSRKFDRIKDSIKANLWHLTASILLRACSATQYRTCHDHRDVYTAARTFAIRTNLI